MAEHQHVQNEKVMVQVRLPKDLVKQIDHVGVDQDTFRAATIEMLLRRALENYKA